MEQVKTSDLVIGKHYTLMLRDQQQKIIIDNILYYPGTNRWALIDYSYYYEPLGEWFKTTGKSYSDGSYYFRIMQQP